MSDENSLDQRDLNNLEDRKASEYSEDGFLENHLKEGGPGHENVDKPQGLPDIDPIAVEAENTELKDRVMRLSADMENLRRRTARDVIDAKTYSITNFARDMLSVSDNLARALDAIPEGARESDQKLKSLAEGVEMTERAMITALQCYGVKKIEALGQKFDPYLHQAIFEIADPGVPASTVTQIVQAGYMIGERVLRPAMVGVTKGGAKTDVRAEESAEEVIKQVEE
ncbi:MAG: molecular chaperone GrpE [Candidatus Tokpelaia sp. JSC188]|nr:MAG: molecular chaperone GrpE [Candidatus Tokpelaia sp. JSC188]